MANADVRAAAATLDAAIQALDPSALQEAVLTPGKFTSGAYGNRDHLARQIALLKALSADYVAELEALKKLENHDHGAY